MIYRNNFAFAIGNRLQDLAEIFIRQIDIQIFKRLEQLAALTSV